MNNLEFWNAIKEFDEHKNPYGNELVCDQIVIQGLGQTKGGHFVTACEPRYNKQVIREKAEPSQQFHFFSYISKSYIVLTAQFSYILLLFYSTLYLQENIQTVYPLF